MDRAPVRPDDHHPPGGGCGRPGHRRCHRPRASTGGSMADFALASLIALIIALTMVGLVVMRSIWIVPQARARNVERFGRYRKTLQPGMNFIIPFVDKVKPL